MASLNKITLIGNVGRDPEVRQLPSGDAVANFTLATSETWKDKKGEKQERTEWHRVDVFGKLAEVVESYVKKGSKVYVEGAMTYDEWTDKDGNKKTAAKVKVNQFGGKLILLGGKGDNGSEGRSSRRERPTAADSAAASDDEVF
jgi:single-strand DNA-binding protein